MLKFLHEYAALILAVLVAAPYLAWRRGYKRRLKEREAAAFDVCGPSGEGDRACRREPLAGPRPPAEGP